MEGATVDTFKNVYVTAGRLVTDEFKFPIKSVDVVIEESKSDEKTKLVRVDCCITDGEGDTMPNVIELEGSILGGLVNITVVVEWITFDIEVNSCILRSVEKSCVSTATDKSSRDDGKDMDIIIAPSVARAKYSDVLTTIFVAAVDKNCS